MIIYEDVQLRGTKASVVEKALIDTGATVSLIPGHIAEQIGVWPTQERITLHNFQGEPKVIDAQYVIAELFFPALNGVGSKFAFAVDDKLENPIIGLDIMNLLGVSIDTSTGKLEIKNKVWEAFKTLSGIVGVGVLVYFGIKKLSE